MKRFARQLLAAAAICAANAFAATTTTVVDIPSGSVTQRILYVLPDNAVATIVVVPGGNGVFGIQNDGSMNTVTAGCSPFGRNRQAFADRGFAVALVDAASDGSVYIFENLREVVREVRRRLNAPVWVTGGSASTSAVVSLAVNLPAADPIGAVFFAPQFVSSIVGQIRRPTQVIYHSADTTHVGGAFFNALTGTTMKENTVLSGGSNASCGFHLFNGLDAEFVNATAAFMLRFNSSLQPADANVQGLWWGGQSQSGWGVNLAHQGDTLFATWFTYDLDGSGLWLSSDAHRTAPNTYTGQLYQSRSAPFTAYIGAQFSATPVGAATFTFSDANTGMFAYTVNGLTQSKNITRYVFDSRVPICTKGGTQNPAAPNFEDLWWNSPPGSENGWGVNISHQGDTLFATWFTYGPDGSDMWMVMSAGRKVGERTYTGEIHRTRSAPFNAYDASRFMPTLVGSGTFTFTDTRNGTFSYTVDGITQTKPITRFIFDQPQTTCAF